MASALSIHAASGDLERNTILAMRKAHLLESFLVQRLIDNARKYLGDDSFMENRARTASNACGRTSEIATFSLSSRPTHQAPDVEEQPSKRHKLSQDSTAPCLRCRVLKKKCDSNPVCSHCPSKGFDYENDHWKVLGCVRGSLKEIAGSICLDFSRAPSRVLKCQSGELLKIDFTFAKSGVSLGKKKRIVKLMHSRKDFMDLCDSSWSDLATRRSLSRHATIEQASPEDVFSPHSLSMSEEYEAPWALIQAVSMDSRYVLPTEYNPFALLRFGNAYLKDGPASWDLFSKSKSILRQSVEIYLLERLCVHIASGDLTGPPPFDPSKLPISNSLIMVDIKTDIEDFLTAFERACAGRSRLTGQQQLACLYSLLVFSIVKSLLIDAYSLRKAADLINPWDVTHALSITSAFKSMVSIFCWSSKTDAILSNNLDKWPERGFKTTRDFLMALGSLILPGDNYNGFFRQKFGIEKLPNHVHQETTLPFWAPDKASYLDSSDEEEQSVLVNPILSPPTDGTSSSFFSSQVPEIDQRLDSPRTLSPSPSIPIISRSRSNSISTGSESGDFRQNSRFTFVINDQSADLHKKSHKGRRGALDDTTLKKVRDVRKIGACWHCWAMKVPCSNSSPCHRCKARMKGDHHPCSRAPFISQISLFFPQALNTRFTPYSTDVYVSENVATFNALALPIRISWLGHRELELFASPFTSTENSQAQIKYDGHAGNDLGVASLPIGLSSLDFPKARDACQSHIESLIQAPSISPWMPLYPSSTKRPAGKEIFKLVHSFYKSGEETHGLLHDVLSFHLMLGMMSEPILFTNDSAEQIISRVGIPQDESNYYSSRVLDRQIKQILYEDNLKTLENILRKLEKAIRARNVSSWPVVFASVVLLSFSIEVIQSQAATYVSTLSPSLEIPADADSDPSNAMLKEANAICESIEKDAFAQLSYLFHTVYRTAQINKGGLNPFHNLGSLSTQVKNLIVPFIQILEKQSESITINKIRALPSLRGGTHAFALQNSGRLLSKFLVPFEIGNQWMACATGPILHIG
ncbi:Zn2/Cys6 DNA-binding protein [Glarea lozoyensis ATCC 20868]|uniref:Zn2/Cys6 DNA-binding protein n=1 Tax=Glarea lozoyensis (strain ATCC 20868 / MF5171) TaxID=1116229 RepID=S3D5R9_GLAL2|nr:Zn2/Cys6 DNA-binding protein [Glarea lozoyensis ATCC 20868]EPE32479.1 Zn2/Cys6 DNA-binding protein [Glarea lozoyensis ATCC 20868]